MEPKTEHLILCEMLSIVVDIEQHIEHYNLNLPPLNLDSINAYENYLRYTTYIKRSKIIQTLQNLFDSYMSLKKEMSYAH